MTSLRNKLGVEDLLTKVYHEGPGAVSRGGEADEIMPALLPKVLPLHQVIEVDAFIPGCPPDPERIWLAVVALLDGEPVLFDWGARLDGYCSDTSRTIVLGNAGERFRQIFDVVAQAQNIAIKAIRAGASTKAVDSLARKHIEDKGYKGHFGHALGHGTGLAVHEPPRLSPLNDTRLDAGMLVTVEPGIYLPDWGGVRIENQVVVRKDSAEVLNRLDVEINP